MTWLKFWQDLGIVTVISFAIWLMWLADSFTHT